MELRKVIINGKDTKHLVSDDGRVFSLVTGKQKEKKQQRFPNGYKFVTIAEKSYMVHRLVATAFIHNPFPEENTVVNHLNMDKTDNRVENLEWTTQSENLRVARMHLRKYNGIPVYQFDKNRKLVYTWKNIYEFEENDHHVNEVKLFRNNFLYMRCGCLSLSPDMETIPMRTHKPSATSQWRPVAKYTMDGQFIESYPNTNMAARENGLWQPGVKAAASGKTKYCGKWKWKYIEENNQNRL